MDTTERATGVAGALGPPEPALPEIVSYEEFVAAAPAAPPQLVEGLLHQGCKLVLGGMSKANKSWSLLELGLSVASGQPWWGRPCSRAAVVYVNFELPAWAMGQRLAALVKARPELAPNRLHLWNLRGYQADLTRLRPRLEAGLARCGCGLIVLDPAYKLLGERDENANGEIANLMNEFEALAGRTGAGLVIAHHFAKGDAGAKSPIDRLSGAGAWARDPDALLLLTPHEEEDCYTVSSIVRHLPPVPEFVVRWEFPRMHPDAELNPEALRRPQARHKKCTDHEFLESILGEESRTFSAVITSAQEHFGMARRTAMNYLTRLVSAGFIQSAHGRYWRSHHSDETH